MSGAKSKQPAPASAPIPSSLLEDFYTQPALAGELGVNKRTLQRWEQKRIAPPHIQIGRMRLYSKATVRTWLLANETKQLQRRAR
jgi:transcriptional regulator with XRE-family HTH domain